MLSDEKIENMREELKQRYNYDKMSDEGKKLFDKTFDDRIKQYKQDNGDGDDSDDSTDNNVTADRGMNRERSKGGSSDGDKKEDRKQDEDAVKQKELEAARARMLENQCRLEAEKQRRAEEAEQADKREKGEGRSR